MTREVIPPAARRASEAIILIVDDDPAIGEFLQQMIEEETPYRGIHLLTGEDALAQVGKIKPDLLLLDYRLPGMDGLELYDKLMERRGGEKIPAIMMSAALPEDELRRRHIHELRKPMDIRSALRMITHALASYEDTMLSESSAL